MSERVLVEALRARDPGALAVLYDTYAEDIHRFCIFVLGSPDGAQVALRDTLIAAEANIHVLSDPARLRLWLLALARVECDRRALQTGRGGPAPAPDPPPAARAPGAELSVIAWHATWSLPPADRRVLGLATGRGLGMEEIAEVTGMAAGSVREAHEAALGRLRDAVTAEYLARKGPSDCLRRARILAGFRGELTPQTRERLVGHIARCDACGPHRARQISAAKVFDLLPATPLPETLRVRVLSCFTDPGLLPYRRYVAGRVGMLDARGFPARGIKGGRRVPVAAAGAVAAVATLIAVIYAFGFAGEAPGRQAAANASRPAPTGGGWSDPGEPGGPGAVGPVHEPAFPEPITGEPPFVPFAPSYDATLHPLGAEPTPFSPPRESPAPEPPRRPRPSVVRPPAPTSEPPLTMRPDHPRYEQRPRPRPTRRPTRPPSPTPPSSPTAPKTGESPDPTPTPEPTSPEPTPSVT
ncbi:hypothetical protein DP939_41805 [Spongiactinospora rosea]|uniref:RNA polymerase sigma-70 region 4 domain-containing protein n=1 Tax=Spongiactinospora rosea TaxID=2248750 RepID=A0A366LJY5_9ACTN|nr:sigma factor-like helix-turn-helix DNA-binding protein [Spongiactinospora rosea]RBQ14216.1 hypothetical protein DP939_41805 [Spongiactinospora rosea]